MNKFCFIAFLFAILILCTSCQQTLPPSPSSNYMMLDSIRYIDKFPQSFTLTNDVPVDLDIIGMNNFVIHDSLFVFSMRKKEGIWSFFSVNNYKFLGDFLRVGGGPNEFIQAPSVSSATFFTDKGQLCAGILDFQLGKIYKMNIDNSLLNKELDISVVVDSLPKYLFNFVLVDSVTFFCREISNDQTQQTRYILNKGEKVIPDNFEKLNRATLNIGEDCNILSTAVMRNMEGNLIVEMPIGLNQINLYSIDNSFGKTICVGSKLDNLDKIQSTFRWNRIYTYADLRVFNDFFAALYIIEDNKTYQTERVKLPVIHLFDWDGEPIAELKLNRFITDFDIDFINGYLYTLDHITDEFYKYEIQDVLTKIQKQVQLSSSSVKSN